MKGYVMNKLSGWAHAMKRAVAPGGKIPLEELFKQYGDKYNLKEGQEFIDWLKTVKLPDTNRWKIVVESEGLESIKDEQATLEANSDQVVNKQIDNVAPMVATKMSVKDVVGLPVRKAREVLPTIRDSTLLRYALQEANQLAGKDSLCILIRKRLQDLQISR